MSGPGRGGFALPFAVFALLLLGAISALLLELATLEARNGRARLAQLRARASATAAAVEAAERWPGDTARALPRGDRLPVLADTRDGFDRTATLERVGRESYLVRGRAVGSRAAAAAEIGLLLRTVPPREILETFGAALAVPGGVVLAATARVDGTVTAGPPPASACAAAGITLLRDVFGAADLPGVVVPDAAALVSAPGAEVRGAPPVLVRADTVRDRLGPIDARSMGRNADAVVTGGVHPAPRVVAGVCDVADPLNWGSTDSAHACADHAPLIVVEGSLAITGGSGQGVLVVTGDLTLSGGARFAGLVLVGGRIDIAADARIDGLVRAEGADATRVDGVVRAAPCPIWRALTATPGLRLPFLPAGHRWIPQF